MTERNSDKDEAIGECAPNNPYVFDNEAPAGEQWYPVTDPYAHLLAPAPKLKRSMKNKQQINAERRQARAQKQKSPYLQVSLSEDKAYQARLKAILK